MAELARRCHRGCPVLATRPGFHGACHRGHMRCVRALKRHQAALRQAASRSLASRRPRIAPAGSAVATVTAARPKRCLWPWKVAYPDKAAASAGLVLLRRDRDRKRRLGIYECRNGRHWHIGSPKPIVTWPRLAGGGHG